MSTPAAHPKPGAGESVVFSQTHPEKVRDAFRAFAALTDSERESIVCWFCDRCWRYVGPGDHCACPPDAGD